MYRRSVLQFCVLPASFGLIAGSFALRAQDDSHHGRKYKAPPPSSTISVTVVRGYNGKPIPGAHVIFHPIEGDKDKGALELKTGEDGKATIDVIPLGDTVTLQVIADGFQTYGQVYKIDKLNMAMEVRMNRPTRQYSIYNHPADNSGSGDGSGSGNGSGSNNASGSGDGSGKSSGSAPDSKPSSPPSDSGSKPSQSDPPPSQNQSQPK
ncbi:MAG TPA: carboxypeptidase-like regulatory domain-containing protein [Terracidiphilus sp.]|nr:carboxypeptidase-like regulatory domain-containing protein [Terracidiphilus sp.]